jgi:hypothetical protein
MMQARGGFVLEVQIAALVGLLDVQMAVLAEQQAVHAVVPVKYVPHGFSTTESVSVVLQPQR